MNATTQFILICLAVVGGLLLLAWLFEHFFCKDRLRLSSPKYITTVAISAALAGILMLLELPLVFLAPSFYKVDLSELPVLICTFYLGPVAGVLTEFLKILIKLLLKSSSTAFVGELANFAVGCALVLPASMIYHFKRTRGTAVLGLAVGTLVMAVFGSLFNAVYLLPAFAEMFHMPLEALVEMGTEIHSGITDVTSFVLLAVAPLNLLKGLVVSLLTMLLYKRVQPIMFKRS
ncbi:MAG: ECF transporter S component [Oscillospiraceae bacterium]|nr:ECF transporter S component [Oscillospiraceae bacterium]